MEEAIVRVPFEGYRIGLSPRAANVPPEQLVKAIGQMTEESSTELSGRGKRGEADLPEVGPVFVKQYTRGGVFRRFVSERYLRWGQSRGELEFRRLQHVRSLGVRAPEPIAFIERGGPFYRAWLLTSFVKGSINLAELSRSNEERAARLLVELVREVSLLVKHQIFHVDLHPGNVLVNPDDLVYLLDFDKAYHFRGSAGELRDQYLRRWRRAVLKHQLPDYLIEIVSLGLRQYESGERTTYA